MKLADGREYKNVAVDVETLQAAQRFISWLLPRMTPDDRKAEISAAYENIEKKIVMSNAAAWLPALQAGEAAIKETADNASVHYDKNALLAIVGMLCNELRAAYGVVEKRAPIPYTLEIHQQALHRRCKTRSGLSVKLFCNPERDPCFVGWVGGLHVPPMIWYATGKHNSGCQIDDLDLFVDEESAS